MHSETPGLASKYMMYMEIVLRFLLIHHEARRVFGKFVVTDVRRSLERKHHLKISRYAHMLDEDLW